MSDYKVSAPVDEPKQRVGEAFWPDYLLSMAITWQGVNNRLPAEKLPNGIVADAQNVRMRTGDIEPRLGVVKPGWLNAVSSLKVIPAASTLYGGGVFSDPNTREWVFYAGDGQIFACAAGNVRLTVSLPPGVKVLGQCSFAQAFNQFFCFRGRYLAPLVLRTWANGFEDVVAQYNPATVYDAAIQAIEQTADEMAYGPFIGIASMSGSGNTVTVATAAVHGYITGADVTIKGMLQTEYNGRWNITVLDAYTFTYHFGGSSTAVPNKITLTSLTHSGTTATATKTAHGFTTGQQVTVAGATPAAYNGTFLLTVTSSSTFTYTMATTPASNASGTITAVQLSGQVSNMSRYWQALGDRLTLAAGALTNVGTVATVAYTGHGLSVGNWVTISGAAPAGYNGLYQVQTVADANHFTYTVAGGLQSPATGTIYVYKPTVTAGHTPDSNPESWQQDYEVLPNAAGALYVDGRLLVPTAYTPGDNGYDSTSSWTKVDYIVAMEVNDPVHFVFTNGFRINQGDDSEITNLVKYDNNTVIVTKGKRWGVLSNVTGDLSAITWDGRGGTYGCPAGQCAVQAGKDVQFPSPQRGMTSLNQTTQGLIQSMDVPFSANIEAWVKRINWNAVGAQRVAAWGDYLYWAVALDSSAVNNALLVYDFRNANWVSLDTGTELGVVAFVEATYQGQPRLFFLGVNGWVNLLEEATAGDQVQDGTQPGGLGWAPIPTSATLKGHLFGQPGQKQFPLIELGLAVWGANFTVTVTSGGRRTVRTPLLDKSFSRTAYLKPFYRQPWNPLNLAGDWAEPNRGDYSVLLQNGMVVDGVSTLEYQELFLRPSTKTFRAPYALITINNAAGRLKIKAVTPGTQAGERRMGLMI